VQLPFTKEQFFDLLAAYNVEVWPDLLALWIASVLACVLLLSSPTMIFTAGLLMLATPRSWRLSILPVIWSLIRGSAAFLLGVHADYALPLAGVALAIFSTQRSSDGRGSRNAPGQLRPVTQTY